MIKTTENIASHPGMNPKASETQTRTANHYIAHGILFSISFMMTDYFMILNFAVKILIV
jgi:hypothetical protein